MTMQNMIEKVLSNTSPAELRHITQGDMTTAEWITKKVLPKLTQNQVESVAFRVLEQVAK